MTLLKNNNLYMPIKYNTEIFREISTKKHKNKYNYDKVDYINNSTPVNIICEKHGIFSQRPSVHMKGGGCTKCVLYNNSIKYRKKVEDFIKSSISTHGDKYDYSEVKYVNNKTKVRIKCEKHGIFNQSPRSHLNNKSGCPECANKNVTTEKFIDKCLDKYGDKYDYSKVIYENAVKKVVIICDNNHTFNTTPNNHLSGKGCPICRESLGERIISKILDEKDVNYEKQKMFEGCEFKRKLKFDFYIPSHNLCIEYDGEQHFNKFRFEKTTKELNIRMKRDSIKNQYCVNNGINLLRVSYKDKLTDIEDKLRFI